MKEAERLPISLATPATVGALLGALSRELATGGLAAADVEREAREIVSALLGVPRFWPLTNANQEVDAATLERAVIAALGPGFSAEYVLTRGAA